MQEEYNFIFRSKFGELRGSSYLKDYNMIPKDNIIDEFIRYCKSMGFDIDLCRLIRYVGVLDEYNVSDCLNHYIDSIAKQERYGILNDAILIMVKYPRDHIIQQLKSTIDYEPNKYFANQVKLAGFVEIGFVGHDPLVRYYAHKNNFIKAIIAKYKGD